MTDETAAPERTAYRIRRRGVRLLTARPWLTALVAVLVAGGVVAAIVVPQSAADDSATAMPSTRLASVTTGTVAATVSATGTIAAADDEDVSWGSAAEITSVRVAQGDKVTAGQVLGTIDTVGLKATLADARATRAQAESTLTDAENADDTGAARLAADKASVAQAKSAVTAAEQALAKATLRSPIAGTVAEVNVAKGDQSTGSTGSSSSGSGASGSGSDTSGSDTSGSSGDFVVIGQRAWTVSASLDDTEIDLVAKGDQVKITTDNVTGTVFGTVTSVSVLSSGSGSTSGSSGASSGGSSTTGSSGSASYPVTVSVTGSPRGLHDGASATLAIVYKQATDVLTVPTLAIRRDGTSSYVYVSRNGSKTKQTVRTGLASGGTTQITSGLGAGQQVYVETPAAVRGTGNTGNRGTGNRGTGQQGGFGGEGGPPGGFGGGVGGGSGTGGFGGGFGGGSGGGTR